MKVRNWMLCISVCLILIACGDNQHAKNDNQSNVNNTSLYQVSDEIILAFKAKNWDKVAAYFHPQKCVIFSPYSYINTEENACLTASEFLKLAHSGQLTEWGIQDGTGDTIRLSLDHYVQRYVYDKPYDTLKESSLNNYVHYGSSLDNLNEIFNKVDVVEYYIPGTEEYANIDWRQLKLVFEVFDNKYYLVGIVHNEWTS